MNLKKNILGRGEKKEISKKCSKFISISGASTGIISKYLNLPTALNELESLCESDGVTLREYVNVSIFNRYFDIILLH